MSDKNLSIVIPAFNEERCIPVLLRRLNSVIVDQLIGHNVEVIIIDDHSTDETHSILKAELPNYPWLKCYRLLKNSGSHIALLAGLSKTKGNWAFCMGADLQDPPEIIPNFMNEALEKNVKIIFGERKKRDEKITKIIPSKIFNFLVSKFIVKNYPTNGSDVFLLHNDIVKAVVQSREKNVNIFLLMLSFTDEIGSVPYNREKRFAGTTKWNFYQLLKLAYDSVISIGTFPLKFMFWVGLTIFSISILVLIYLVFGKITGQITQVGWASTTGAIVLFGGIQMMCLSIIGEYLWRNFEQTRSRPIYLFEGEDS